MSVIGKNIKKIRSAQKISQNEFSDLFNVSRASVGSYEEGRAEPRIDTIISIANHFSLSIDALLTKELTYDELYQLNILEHDTSDDQINPLAIIDKDQRKEDTPLVTKENYLEYIVNYDRKDYINNLPFIRLPNTQHEKTRALRSAGQRDGIQRPRPVARRHFVVLAGREKRFARKRSLRAGDRPKHLCS